MLHRIENITNIDQYSNICLYNDNISQSKQTFQFPKWCVDFTVD